MSGKEHASDFEKIIHEARDRKKNEALAAKIFGRDRRSSTPQQKTSSQGGSLANRAGVKKRVASTGPRGAPTGPRSTAHTGNIDGDWTHDLHERHASAPSTPRGGVAAAAAPRSSNSLASRITNANAPAAGPASRVRTNPRRTAQVAQALIRTELAPASAPRAPAAGSGPWSNTSRNGGGGGLTIRGLAGPFVVMAQNFAPGTTAADIESAVTPVGGLVQSCRLLKTDPIVIAEIVFESKEGADRVIETFDNQTADGRLIHVYYKAGGGVTPAARAAPTNAPSGPRAKGNNLDAVVDGSMGFDDPMETDKGYVIDTGRGRDTRSQNGLYSDSLVQGNGRGQAQQRGRGGGGGGGDRGHYGRGRRGGPGR